MERAPVLLETATMSIEGTSRGGGGVDEAGAAVEVVLDDESEVAEEAGVGELLPLHFASIKQPGKRFQATEY